MKERRYQKLYAKLIKMSLYYSKKIRIIETRKNYSSIDILKYMTKKDKNLFKGTEIYLKKILMKNYIYINFYVKSMSLEEKEY